MDVQGRIQGVAVGSIAPPTTCESNFVHHDFVQFGKEHSRYKVILPPTGLSEQGCKEYFISLTVAYSEP